MRLANGIVIDKEATFGALKFSALRREVHLQNEDGSVSEEIKERTYDLKSRGQGRMIQVSIPASVPLKEFDYNAEVELINPVADTVATATFQGAEVDWYIKADDIVLKKGAAMNPQPPKKDRRERHHPHRRRSHIRRLSCRQGHTEGRNRTDRRRTPSARHLRRKGKRSPRFLAEGSARRGWHHR